MSSTTKQHLLSPKHVTATQDYLYRRGPAARRRRVAEREGLPSAPSTQPINPENVIEANGLPKWENDLIGA